SFARVCRMAETAGAPVPLGVTLRIVADVCEGLHVAHELKDASGVPQGVVHRDVSPDNVLVSSHGVAKIIDFGIAKARGRLTLTRGGVGKGKISYMAPEQAAEEPIDRRTDVWAIGAVLFRALCGHPPFDSEQALVEFACGIGAAPALTAAVPEHVRV